MTEKIKYAVYELLREEGGRSRANIVLEYVICMMICLNVVLIIVESLSPGGEHPMAIAAGRWVFFIFFLTEYALRVWVADIPKNGAEYPFVSRIKYMLTFTAIVNFLALLPVALGKTNLLFDFRIFRILRLIRILRIKTLRKYTDTIEKVVRLKGPQLLASMFIVFVFMLVFAAAVYDLEHDAQPTVFSSIPAALWWSISAFTTAGYGDMNPVTPMGRILGSCASVFGIFLLALPIAILTSGFYEISRRSEYDGKRKRHD